MVKNLRNKTISGMLWSSVGQFGKMALSFLSNLVLARLLLPSDYGCVGMLHVFIAVSNVFVAAGFGSALVQKKSPKHVDYTSVFYWSLVTSIIFYWILFFSAPAIARFYSMPELRPVLRVQSLGLVLQTFVTVQNVQLQKQLRFKELSKRSIYATLIGTLVGVVMAFYGFGVWSLVVSHLVGVAASIMLLWKMSSWRPTLEFSWASLKELFSFGGLVALSSLVETIYNNLLSLVLGKWYSASDLGYYTQARKLEQIPTGSLGSIVGLVSFPVFSSLQDAPQKLLNGLRHCLKSVMYLNVPMMILLLVIAHPLIMLLYGAKWEVSAMYFQILCIGGVFFTLNSLNVTVIKALGKGKVYFFTQLAKRLLAIVLIFVSFILGKMGVVDGVLGLIWALTISHLLNVVINTFIIKKLTSYGLMEQFKDIFPYFLIAILLAGLCYLIQMLLPFHEYFVMVIQVVMYVSLYILLSKWFNIEGYDTYKNVLLSKLKLNKRNKK